MTLDEALARLESLGNERVRELNAKRTVFGGGVTGAQFGVKLGDIRAVAKAIKADHPLALQLWATGNFDARLLAILIMKPRSLRGDGEAGGVGNDRGNGNSHPRPAYFGL
jgi:3-methyladenine DNA glycosylase AlkD